MPRCWCGTCVGAGVIAATALRVRPVAGAGLEGENGERPALESLIRLATDEKDRPAHSGLPSEAEDR